jgi:excisionase family DNA binding protein
MRDVLTLPPVSTRRPSTISVGAAARITGYHPATIRRALLRGDLEGYRAGTRGMYRIPAGALDDWLRPAHDSNEETP